MHQVNMTLATGTRRFVYDPQGRVMGEYGLSAADVKAEFIWLSPEVGGAGAFGGDDGLGGYMPLAVATPDSGGIIQLNWVYGGHLGVPLVTTNAAGSPATTPNDYLAPGFPGQSRVLADLYYNRYRDYDPSTGRYIQADPIGLEGGQNDYVYAGGNPINWIDPDGRNPIAVAAALCLRFPAQCSAAINAIGAGIVLAINPPVVPKVRPVPSPGTDPDCIDRCETAKQKARSIYYDLTRKRIPQYESGGSRGSDGTHYDTIKAKQNGLRDAIRRVYLYCRPLPPEVPEWERVANMFIPILH